MNLITTIASVITALGVIFVFWQIWLSIKQARTTFEDSLAKEFRDIISEIPIKALLGQDLSEDEYNSNKIHFYRYIDLTNEQTFLHLKKRISDDTWQDWCEGIASLLTKPAFKKAWEEIKNTLPNSFQELRCLEISNYNKCKN